MFQPRPLIFCAALLAVAPIEQRVDAGCLDWLFGRRPAYAAQYAPVAVSPTYAANYAPTYSANYGAIPLAPRRQANGVYQAQRPAYYNAPPVMYNNPSVYTGRPVIMGQPSLAGGTIVAGRPVLSGTTWQGSAVTTTAPLVNESSGFVGAAPATAYRVPSATSDVPLTSSFRGAGSLPTSVSATINSPYVSGYQSFQGTTSSPGVSSPGLPMTTIAPSGTPPSALPATPVAPLYVTPDPRPAGGLARFFGSLLGTRYRTSYYRAPITYYRPVTTIDPVTGAAVVVQQPCTSTVQQLQRIPVGTLQYAPPAVTTPSTCQTYPTQPPTSTYGTTSPYGSVGGAPSNGIGQVGGVGPSTPSGVAPIPSTMPPPYSQAPYWQGGTAVAPSTPNQRPLSGSPPRAAGDLAPLDRPELPLNSPPPATDESSHRESSPTQPPAVPLRKDPPASYWDSEEVEESTASLLKIPPIDRSAENDADPPELPRYTGLPPIPAPDDYQSPLRNRDRQPPSPATPAGRTFQAPPLPSAVQPTTSVSVPDRITQPEISTAVREASLSRPRQAVSTKPRSINRSESPVRDGSGWRTISP